MGVTRVAPRWEGRGATTDEKAVRTLQRQWTVETDDDDTGEPEVIDGVIAFDATAALYAPHPKWPWSVCRKLKASPNSGPRVWTVDAEYSSAPFEARGDGSGENGNTSEPSPQQSNQTPADQRPPQLTITRKEVTKPLEKDVVTGAPIVNKPIGDPFDPPPEVFRSHHIITWKFHRAPRALNWAERSTYMDTINDAEITILGRKYPKWTLRCTDYSLGTVWDTGQAGLTLFFELTVQAEFNPDTWIVSILNTGRRKKVGGSIGNPADPPKIVAITDAAGQPIADPVPLDLVTGEEIPPGGEYQYAEFDGYLPKPWANILQ